MKPAVGLPCVAENTKCAHQADIDAPFCDRDAQAHLMVKSSAWGVVGLLACPDHEAIARATGEPLGEHPAGDACRFLTGECWS